MDDLFEPFSPVNSPDHLFDLSDEEGKRVSLVLCVSIITVPLSYVFLSPAQLPWAIQWKSSQMK